VPRRRHDTISPSRSTTEARCLPGAVPGGNLRAERPIPPARPPRRYGPCRRREPNRQPTPILGLPPTPQLRPLHPTRRWTGRRSCRPPTATKAFARELVDLFIASGDEALATITAALHKGDYATVSAQAHALKGASANLQAVSTSAVAAELEAAARAAPRLRSPGSRKCCARK